MKCQICGKEPKSFQPFFKGDILIIDICSKCEKDPKKRRKAK